FARRYPRLPTSLEAIEAFLADMRGAAESKKTAFYILHNFYRFISPRAGFANPMASDEATPPRCPNKVMASLDAEDMHRLLHAASKPRDRALLILLIDTGLRSSEAASLRVRDIREGTILVQGKSGQRLVPTSEETRRTLLALAEGSLDGYVFHGERGRLTRGGVYNIVRAAMERAGISGPKLGAHRIRHAFGRGYLVNGGDVHSLQRIMGHSNMATTQKYLALSPSEIVEKHHQFTPLKAVRAAAQTRLFAEEVVAEAEAILQRKKSDRPCGRAKGG
ncbi:MAG: tyrosine-type recombinase/integrase, partial [Patescibacteria group bacterium]